MNALARHYVGQGDARGQDSHPHFTIPRLGALFFNHPKCIRSTVVSDDYASVSHGPLPPVEALEACADQYCTPHGHPLALVLQRRPRRAWPLLHVRRMNDGNALLSL